jgi:demethylmenaquinone methyltransferase/2-methoxy-6-polyprenyl-1,4-benzoquinol methylase
MATSTSNPRHHDGRDGRDRRSLIPSPDQPLPTGEAKVDAIEAMFDTIAPRYDLVNRVMTFRMDVGWRRTAIDALALAPGRTVLDLAAGTGDLVYELERRGLRAVGLDLSYGMLAAAPRPFPRVQGDGQCLPVATGAVDGVTCGFALRNFESLAPMFAELARVVRPRGRIALLEVDEPANPLMAFGHRFYFGKVVPVIGGILSDGNAYRYLPRSVEYLPSSMDMLAMLADVGFEDARYRRLSGGIAQLLTATRSTA